MDLPSDIQHIFAYIMSEDDGDSTLHDFIAKRVAVDGIDEQAASTAEEYPNLSPHEARSFVLFTALADLEHGWLRRGVARRFSLDDPSELAQFLSMNSRVAFVWSDACRAEGNEYTLVWDILRAIAARDMDVANAIVQSGSFPLTRGHRLTLPVYNGVHALLTRKTEYAQSFNSSVSSQRKPTRWFKAIYTTLKGIFDGAPGLVNEGIGALLDAPSIWVQKYEKVVCFEAHGLFELARWISPDLVSLVDVDRPLPWDREFYLWAATNESPMKTVSLPDLPEDISQGLLHLARPAFMKVVDAVK